MNKKSPMRKLYDSKVFWLIISLIASLAIWIVSAISAATSA